MATSLLRASSCAVMFLMAAAGAGAAEREVHYVCGDGDISFKATFVGDDSLVLQIPGAPDARLKIAISGSGFRYVGQGHELHGKGDEAIYGPPGAVPVACRAAPEPTAAPPPPTALPARPSFDCGKARSPTERAICGNAMLAELDRKAAELYAGRRNELRGKARRALRTAQKRWLRRRNACRGNVTCIEKAYSNRIAGLEKAR